MTERSLEDLARELGQECLKRGVRLAAAESLTAGAVSAAVTEVPGSSAWFDRGFVVYQPEAKIEMLGVPAQTIEHSGVVSEAVAGLMACGALARSHAAMAVAVTGIAGPGGAEPGKPVGTVCFGFAGPQGARSHTMHFSGDRHAVREATVRHALEELLSDVKALPAG